MHYRIVPLVLSKYLGEKGIMTFLTDYGTPIIRPFVMWCVQGHEKNILIDSAIEAKDYQKYDPRFRDLEIDSMMSFEEALESVNLTPDRIDIVIQTHLHFDHCYNTRKCTKAKIVVQESELAFARNPSPFGGLYRKELYEGLDFEVIRGDRRLLEGIDLLSVPGHSAGGQAVRVSTEKRSVLISGLCGIKENFYPTSPHPMAGEGQVILPGIMLDAVKAFNSILRMKELGDTILPLHDPEILDVKSIP